MGSELSSQTGEGAQGWPQVCHRADECGAVWVSLEMSHVARPVRTPGLVLPVLTPVCASDPSRCSVHTSRDFLLVLLSLVL